MADQFFALGVMGSDGVMVAIAVTRDLAICEGLAALLARAGRVAACAPIDPGAAL